MSEVRIVSENNHNLPQKLIDLADKWVREGKQYFGKAGISLQNQLNDPQYKNMGVEINSDIIKIGIEGEKKISKLIRHWLLDHPDCLLIDSLSLPVEKREIEAEEGHLDLGDTDHLIICRNNLIIIDAKNWKSKASYSVNEDGVVLRGKKEFRGGNVRIRQAKFLFEKFYQGYNIDAIESFICVADTSTKKKPKFGEQEEEMCSPFIVRDLNWWRAGFKLVNEESLIYFLNKFYDDLNSDDKFVRVELLAKALTGLNREYNVVKEKWPQLHNKFKL